MNYRDVIMYNEIGRLIVEMKSIIKKMSCLSIADIDSEEFSDYRNDIVRIQDLVIKSRRVTSDNYFRFIAGEN